MTPQQPRLPTRSQVVRDIIRELPPERRTPEAIAERVVVLGGATEDPEPADVPTGRTGEVSLDAERDDRGGGMPVAARLPTRSEVESWFVGEAAIEDEDIPWWIASVIAHHGGATEDPPERCSFKGCDGEAGHLGDHWFRPWLPTKPLATEDPEPEVDPPTFYDAYKAEIDKVEIKGDMPAAAVYGECLRAAKRANDRINQEAENG